MGKSSSEASSSSWDTRCFFWAKGVSSDVRLQLSRSAELLYLEGSFHEPAVLLLIQFNLLSS